ncbi:MAG: dihydroxy-acid dehydratase [Paracrocinitomix sp.]|jgi:dihydroxy-acid dehydratase
MSEPSEKAVELRTDGWYGRPLAGFPYRSWMKRGLPDDAFTEGKPHIGIASSWSELTPCNSHLDEIAEHVKRGVWEAGGIPHIFPTTSLGETQLRPTAMLLRNLMAMDVEESLRGNPVDGVVLLGGCDKTTPAQLMGAASVDLPTVVVSGGPMLNGQYRGQSLGSGTDLWRFNDEVRSGRMSIEDFRDLESSMTRSRGSCNTMGTASTMACMSEALGMALPQNGALPAADSRRLRLAHLSGRRAVEMVHEGLTISKVLTRANFENAIRVLAAIGGSTNAVVHLLAIAGRLGVDLELADFDRLSAESPLLVNLKPSGDYLMEDFAYSGGLPSVIAKLGDIIDGTAPTVMGTPFASYADPVAAQHADPNVIRGLDDPLLDESGIAVLSGNLCPSGAVIKPNAATPELMQHRGRAVVFESIEDYHERIDDPDLDIDPTCVLVLKGCGPKGYPGMAEVGNFGLPARLLADGVTDMVRISDARMSGTAYGTVVLHTAPEAAAGGPLAVVRDGDIISLDVANRSLSLEIDDSELAERLAAWEPAPAAYSRGYYRLYIEHVLQADKGCDFDFLVGSSGNEIVRDSH